MKRIFTFALVALMAIAGFATPQTTTQLSKGQATKALLQREALIANMTANNQEMQAVSTQSNELDTIELEFKSFLQDPIYIPMEIVETRNGGLDTVGGDWVIALQNERYRFNFDFYGGAPDDPSGTYTVDNLDLDYCWCIIPEAPNNSSYPKVCNFTIKREQLSQYTYKYILDVEMVTTLGYEENKPVNGAFKIHAEHKVVIAGQRYDVAVYNCVVTPEEDRFTIVGKNDTMDVDLTFFSDLGVLGYYSEKLLDTENSTFKHRGVAYNVMALEGAVINSETENGDMAYLAMLEILGENGTDTTFFNIWMEAPIIPVDSVDIYCSNLMLTVSQGAVVVEASNSKYEIYAGYNDAVIRDSATYVGTSTAGNAMVYITDLETEMVIGAITTTLTVVGSKQKGYLVTAQVLGSDHKYYDLYLTNVLPDKLDTVAVDFPMNSKAMFDIDELGLYELLIANYNGEYSASFDILNINQIMNDSFEKGDLFIDEQEVTTYLVKHTPEGDVAIDLVRVDGKIYQEKDTTFLNATIVGFDSTVYNVSMYYTIPKPTETLSYAFSDDNASFINALPQGIFILGGMTPDGMVLVNVQVNRNYTGTVEGTFICDGNFEENQFEPFETYVATFDTDINEYVPHYMQKGEMVVTLDENNVLHAQASFICDDAKLYNLTFTKMYERPRLPYDAEDEGAECTYAAESTIYIDDYVESDNMLFFSILAADYTSEASLCFIIDHKDDQIIIPEGVYSIDNLTTPATLGTVVASRGLSSSGYPLQSYYAELEVIGNELWYVEGRGFFLVDGTVTVQNVDGKLKMDVDAVNSYDLPVKLHYFADGTGVENIKDNKPATSAKKHIENGQLLIKHNGVTYDVTGARVK